MTREEAIIILKVVDENATCDDCLYYNSMEDCPNDEDCIIRQAFNMAIQALEQEQYYKDLAESYEKTINKLTKAIAEQEPKFIAKSDGTIEQIKNCNDCLFKKEWEKIGKLLSVVLEKQTEQEPKTGEWIEQNDDYFDWYECSECGYGSEGEMQYSSEYDVRTNYCPHCGAKMVGPQADKEQNE